MSNYKRYFATGDSVILTDIKKSNQPNSKQSDSVFSSYKESPQNLSKSKKEEINEQPILQAYEEEEVEDLPADNTIKEKEEQQNSYNEDEQLYSLDDIKNLLQTHKKYLKSIKTKEPEHKTPELLATVTKYILLLIIVLRLLTLEYLERIMLSVISK